MSGSVQKKIVCVQSRNDFTGSPKVLAQCIHFFVDEGYDVDLHCSNLHRPGFLSALPNVNYFPFHYQMSKNKAFRFFNFILAHVLLFFRMFRYRNEDVTFYINTLLPFGAAFAGLLMKKKVIYHVHEAQLAPLFKGFLKYFARLSASKAIYVSEYLKEKERISGIPGEVIYNCLSDEFMKKAQKSVYDPYKTGAFEILMLASLIPSKGLFEMISIAEKVPLATFHLVISEEASLIDEFFKGHDIPANLKIYPAQSNVHPFYQKASLVINLSDTKKYIESFGLTIIEAMAYGIPVIAPPVGGPVELVQEGLNGYKINSKNIALIVETLEKLRQNPNICMELSKEAYAASHKFNWRHMRKSILKAVMRKEPQILSLTERERYEALI